LKNIDDPKLLERKKRHERKR